MFTTHTFGSVDILVMQTSSHVYDMCTTDGEDALFQFPGSNRTLCNLSFFNLSFFILEL